MFVFRRDFGATRSGSGGPRSAVPCGAPQTALDDHGMNPA